MASGQICPTNWPQQPGPGIRLRDCDLARGLIADMLMMRAVGTRELQRATAGKRHEHLITPTHGEEREPLDSGSEEAPDILKEQLTSTNREEGARII